jgi:hypothetical protein
MLLQLRDGVDQPSYRDLLGQQRELERVLEDLSLAGKPAAGSLAPETAPRPCVQVPPTDYFHLALPPASAAQGASLAFQFFLAPRASRAPSPEATRSASAKCALKSDPGFRHARCSLTFR